VTTTNRVLTRTAKLGTIDITHMEHGPLWLDARGDDFGHHTRTLRMLVVLDGEVRLASGKNGAGNGAVLARRDGAFIAGWLPVAYIAADHARVLAVDVPLDHESLRGLSRMSPFVVCPSETALLPALAAFAVGLMRHDAQELTPAVRAHAHDLVTQLIAGALTSLVVPDFVDSRRTERRTRVLEFINSNYADVSLDLATMANRLGMSTRSLQRLLHEENLSFSRVLANRRTEEVVTMLRDPHHANTSLDELAALAGFNTAASMRRAVHMKNGQTPGAIRRQARDSRMAERAAARRASYVVA
jgi:AraC-like DNA-binding protein